MAAATSTHLGKLAEEENKGFVPLPHTNKDRGLCMQYNLPAIL